MHARWVLLSVALLVGCSRQEAKSTPKATNLTGQWIAKLDPTGADPKDPDAVNAVMAAKKFESMNDLQFTSEDKYAFGAGGYLIEGSLERRGNSITLNPEKLNGLDPEVARKGGATTQGDVTLPMTLTLSEDGSTLSMPPGRFGEKLTFVRYRPQVGPDETKSDERPYVGRWHVEKAEGLTPGHAGGGFDYLLKRTAVNLQHDHRFQMRFIYRFEGTWKMTPKGIELTYPSGKMNLAVKGSGLVLSSPDAKVQLFLER